MYTEARGRKTAVFVFLCRLLQQLHWLPTEYRIDVKIINITFRTLHSSQPAYLFSDLHPHHSTRCLRLSNTNLLSVSFVRTSLSFIVAAVKSGTLYLQLSERKPAQLLSAIIYRLAFQSP